MTKFRILLVLAAGLIVGGVFWFDLYQYLTIDFYNEQREYLQEYVQANFSIALITFMLIYIVTIALSLPVGIVLSLSAGALFGVLPGTLIVMIAATLGATLAFLASRFVLQDYVDHHFAAAAQAVNDGISKDGAYYLFSLRLIPLFPFFVINLVMGLTHIKTLTFMWITMVGIIPITLVLTNAGQQLGQVEAPGDIISGRLMISLALIGLVPLATRKLMGVLRPGDAA